MTKSKLALVQNSLIILSEGRRSQTNQIVDSKGSHSQIFITLSSLHRLLLHIKQVRRTQRYYVHPQMVNGTQK